MERQHIVGAALAFLALVAWFVWLAPRTPPPPVPPSPPPESVDEHAVGPGPIPPAEEPAAVALPAAAAEAAAGVETADVDTDLFSIRLTNRGAGVLSWRLKEYRDTRGEPLELLPDPVRAQPLGPHPLEIDLDDADLAKTLNAALYTLERSTATEGGARVETLRYRWSDGRGLTAVKTFAFREDGYLVGLQAEVVDRGRRLPVRLTWGPGFEARDSKRATFHYDSQLVKNVGGRVVRVRPDKVEPGTPPDPPGELKLAGLEDQYFAALLLPEGGGTSRAWPVVAKVPEDPENPTGDKEDKPLPVVAVSIDGQSRLFVGPKSYSLLQELGLDPLRVIWFSDYALLAYLASFLLRMLLWIQANVVSNWGLVIILATAALRLVLFPLNQYSMVSMRKAGSQMQKLQPKLNALKAKYAKKKDADSRRKMQEEMMALYRREGINPFSQVSGCLPILIQFPVLIAFYNVFTVAVELRGAPFVAWIRDLSLPDPYWITPLLMGGTMFYQQKLAMQKSAMDPTQARIMLFMPVVFTVTFLNLPSGLVLYWLVNNLLGIAQQQLVNRHMERLEASVQKA